MNASTFNVLGLDIGGANLKAAHSSGSACCVPFPLWKDPGGLPEALRGLLSRFRAFDRLAVTMTGELCDCFATKREGVEAILSAVSLAAGERSVQIWCNDGLFVSLARARRVPLKVAAANWLALASFVGRFAAGGLSVLVDIGSTTTDIIPLWNGEPVPSGRTDPERLASGELVYTGTRRTPLCTLLRGRGAAEFFATSLDAYLVMELLADDPTDRDTADGRPATCEFAHARLARMLCADLETSSINERKDVAQRSIEEQIDGILAGVRKVCGRFDAPVSRVILSGSGEFLGEMVVRREGTLSGAERASLGKRLGRDVSAAACAYALACLAGENACFPQEG